MNYISALIFICCTYFCAAAQKQHIDKHPFSQRIKNDILPASTTIKITGEISGRTLSDDSLFFVTGRINSKYYCNPIPTVAINNNQFEVSVTTSYPQLWRLLFNSDKGQRIYRHGEYFIDASTSHITVDYLAQECNQTDGSTATEYRTKFIPFFYASSTLYDCHQIGFDKLIWNEDTQFDSTLYRYIQANANSYVALWILIERFSKFGYSPLRESCLTRFSQGIQKVKPWQLLQADMHRVLLRQGEVMQSFNVQDSTQSKILLRVPNAQYTLVDFWFSRCRPCIESFPALKKLYAAYKAKGLEIISISTDQTKDVTLWHKRLREYKLPWPQYLDENAVAATQSAIHIFPATFLLDHTGKIIRSDISPAELEKFLANKLE